MRALTAGLLAMALVACDAPTVDTPIPAARGTIRDRAGRVLAEGSDAARTYPFDDLGEHVIGDVAVGPHGVIGRSGVEAAWDDVLRGTPGVRRAPADAPDETTIIVEPIAGADVTLTIDMELMHEVQRAMRGTPSGAVVVVDVRDGSVLALHSRYAFDRETLEPEDGLLDRAIGRAMPPGGTMKPLTILAGLEAGVLDDDETIDCRGSYPMGARRLHEDLLHGLVDLHEAIASSCAVFPYTVADRVGLDAIVSVERDFGLGRTTGIGLRFEAAGHVASTVSPMDARRTAMHAAIGNDAVEVTPLQLVLAYAAIANGGTLWTPRLTTDRPPRVHHHVHASAEHLASIREGLEATFDTERGTGFEDRSDRVRIAGKTGHGRRVDGNPFGTPEATWFVGYAPANDPQVAIVVETDGSTSRSVAAAVQVLERYLAPVEESDGGTR